MRAKLSTILLTRRFPITLRSVVRDNLKHILTAAAVVVIVSGMHQSGVLHELLAALIPGTFITLKLTAIKLIALTLLTLKLLYSLAYRATYGYRIEGHRLRIQRGIFIREEALLPLLPLTELYLRRSWSDFLFGTANIHIAVPAERVHRIAELRGLSAEDARALMVLLERRIDRSEGSAAGPVADRNKMRRSLPAPDSVFRYVNNNMEASHEIQ